MHHSDGCTNCKRRKVRCDETWPRCLRCIKANLDCPGKSQRPEPSQGELSFRDQTQSIEDRIVRLREGRSRQPGNTRESSRDASSSRVVSDEKSMVSRASFDQLWSNFLSEYLPQSYIESSSTNFGYLSLLATVPKGHAAFDNALRALPLVQIGTTRGDDRLIHASREAYGVSIEQLRLLLQFPKTAKQDATLATMLVLGLCERYTGVCTAPDGWFSHTRGARQYLSARGANSVTSKTALALFNNSRASSVREGILTHKHVNFDSAEWLAVTREISKTDIWSALIDISVHLPGILERVNALIHADNDVDNTTTTKEISNAEAYAQVQNEIDMLIASYAAWYHRVQAHGHTCGLTDASELLSEEQQSKLDPPFEKAYTARMFNNVLNHFLHTAYTAILARAALQLFYLEHDILSSSDSVAAASASAAAAAAAAAVKDADLDTDLEMSYIDEGLDETNLSLSPSASIHQHHRHNHLLDRYKTLALRTLQYIPHMLQPQCGTAAAVVLGTGLWFAECATSELGLGDEEEWVGLVVRTLERRGIARVSGRGLGVVSPLRRGRGRGRGGAEDGSTRGSEGDEKGKATGKGKGKEKVIIS